MPLSKMIAEGENFTYKTLEILDSSYADGDNHIRSKFDYNGEDFTWYIDTPKYFKYMREFKLNKLNKI